MAEGQKWQEPCHRFCANNCGFFGSPTTLHLCSKCFNDHCLKEQQASKAKLAVEKSLMQASSSSLSSGSLGSVPFYLTISPEIKVTAGEVSTPTEAVVPTLVPAAQPNRFAACRRRVGMTGFKCRCGTTFCGTHRSPKQHDCTFDFKSPGREAIAKPNPVVKAEKLDKI